MNFSNFLKTHQQNLVKGIAFVLVAGLGFSLGKISASEIIAPEIRVEEAFAPLNNSSDLSSGQSTASTNQTPNPAPPATTAGLDCKGQIKGNISGSSKVYHLPSGSSYNRTKPEACFATEAEAVAAGFRKANN